MSESGSASNIRAFSGMATPSPKSPMPLDKQKKYDRQLRLWGDHGQAALERARVCLINVTATGTEILKNLILPGVSSFTIVDAACVRGEDAGNNFFLSRDAVGKSRAEVAVASLLELNTDVAGDGIGESCEEILRHRPDFFTSFDVVVASKLSSDTLLRLSKVLWDGGVPLLVCWTVGFLGYMRIAVPEHVVVESHPDDQLPDLRLLTPFPELVDFCSRQDLSSMTKKDHSHTPWLVLLFHAVEAWKRDHDGQPPKTYKEKTALKQILRDMNLKTPEGVPEHEDNFEEALRNVNTALQPPQLPSAIKEILYDAKTSSVKNGNQKSPDKHSSFWLLARAVREFVEKEGGGLLPLRGTLPDMTADSDRYIALQRIYKQQAANHVANVTNHLHSILQQDHVEIKVREQETHTFCRNAASLRVLRYRSLESEYSSSESPSESLSSLLEFDPEGDAVFYPLLRAVDAFHSTLNRFPGEAGLEDDIPTLKTHLVNVLNGLSLSETLVKEDLIHEVCRFGGAELHSVAAFMGGVAAQEVIKLITRQFVPVNNTYVYNAMKQSSVSIKI